MATLGRFVLLLWSLFGPKIIKAIVTLWENYLLRKKNAEIKSETVQEVQTATSQPKEDDDAKAQAALDLINGNKPK